MADDVKKKIILGVDVRAFRRGIQNVDQDLKKMSKTTDFLGKAIGAAFALDIVANFARDVFELGLQVEGVANAFEQLGQTSADLDRLQRATKGTVSELVLMEQAVGSINLGLDAQALPKYFEFATRRARQTNQSVEHLISSIQLGLGRESKLIIDNLSINMAAFNTELRNGATFAQAFDKAVEASLEDMGENIELGIDKVQQMQTAWQDLKKDIGSAAVAAAVFFYDGLGDQGAYNRYLDFHAKKWQESLKAIKESFGYVEKIHEFYQPGGPQQGPLDQAIGLSGEAAPDDQVFIPKLVQQYEAILHTARAITSAWRDTRQVIDFTANTSLPTFEENQRLINQQIDYWKANSEELAYITRTIGQFLQQSFEAALISGEDFFKTIERALGNLIKKLAIAAALSSAIAVFSGGGIGAFFTSFGKLGGVED